MTEQPHAQPTTTPPGPQDPMRSVHTTNFGSILEQLGISVFVTTYQAGKLIVLRDDAATLNTHFRQFARPMGVAVTPSRMAIGTEMQIWEYRNMPAVTQKLEPPDRHDACFLPRRAHHTGDVKIHEMAWVGDELWFVNTLFSCLCTLDDEHSFVPRWRPAYVTACAPEDRCHLNGRAGKDGKVHRPARRRLLRQARPYAARRVASAGYANPLWASFQRRKATATR